MKGTRKFSFACITALVMLSFILPGCKPLIALYDQNAYINATSVKVEVLNLIDKSTESFASHQADIEAVNLKVNKAYEYEKHRTKNEITLKMWDMVMSPDKHLYGGFLKFWQANNTVSSAFASEFKGQVGQAFDLIAELESEKIKKDNPAVNTLLSK